MSAPRIAVCFFGITRSLPLTADLIHRNVLAPARVRGNVSVFAHFFRQFRVDDVRSGEAAEMDPSDANLLHPDRLDWSDPVNILSDIGFDEIASYGDYWQNDHRSLGNLLHQLYSLRTVTEAALETRPDLILFCRPDLAYHDAFGEVIDRALKAPPRMIFLPRWQCWRGGLNDRFAVCTDSSAALAYGTRINLALPYCQATGLPLHSERLVRYAVDQAGLNVRNIELRASRVRLGGAMVEEEFRPRRWRTLKQRLEYKRLIRRGSPHPKT